MIRRHDNRATDRMNIDSCHSYIPNLLHPSGRSRAPETWMPTRQKGTKKHSTCSSDSIVPMRRLGRPNSTKWLDSFWRRTNSAETHTRTGQTGVFEIHHPHPCVPFRQTAPLRAGKATTRVKSRTRQTSNRHTRWKRVETSRRHHASRLECWTRLFWCVCGWFALNKSHTMVCSYEERSVLWFLLFQANIDRSYTQMVVQAGVPRSTHYLSGPPPVSAGER